MCRHTTDYEGRNFSTAVITAYAPGFYCSPTQGALVVERYDDATGTWQTLPTTTEDVTDDTVIVEVETPGFSPFAVTEQEDEEDGDGPTGGDRIDDADDQPVDRIDDDDGATRPAYRVADLGLNTTEVSPNEPVTVSVTVESTRIVESNTAVELRLDDETLRTQRVSLAAGASATVEFTDVRLDGVDPGEYTLGVYTDQASQTATVTVTDSAVDVAGGTAEGGGEVAKGEGQPDETAPPSDAEPADDRVPAEEDDTGVTDDGTPGFGVVLVFTALVAFLVLARHRSRRNR